MKQSRLLLACAALPTLLAAQNLKEFEKNVTEWTLPNGMHFIVLERHMAPVASFHLHVDAGSVNDPSGSTGIAHMFEHMIGKGTTEVGTKNWPAEQKALAAIEVVYDKLESERNKGPRADKAKLEALEKELEAAIEKANQYVVPNDYTRVIESQGAAGFNAGTATDSTTYFYSLPSNRSELWFLLQSQWVKRPVFREFYKERDVVREERRMRIESSPLGKLVEQLQATAFTSHPYHTGAAGWASDIENLRATDAEKFFKTYYVPSNITVAIAGDVKPAAMKALSEKYFGPIAPGPNPPQFLTEEPPQEGEKRVTVENAAQPFLIVGYKRPDARHADDPVFDVVSDILSGGRTGITYKEMVRDKQISLAAQAIGSFPGAKYPNLFLFYSVPTPGHTVEENEKAWYAIIDKLKNELVDKQTLDRVKTKVRAGLIRQLNSNSGLASTLTTYYAMYGDWRKMFTAIEDIDKVTAEDVRRVIRTYFVDNNKTVVYNVQPKQQAKNEETK